MILSGAEIPGVGGFDFPRPSPPLLATQGTADTINPPGLTYAFYDIAPPPKFLLTLIGAPHLPPYTDEQPQLGIVERVTIAFLDRYLNHEPAHSSGCSGRARCRASPPSRRARSVPQWTRACAVAVNPPALGRALTLSTVTCGLSNTVTVARPPNGTSGGNHELAVLGGHGRIDGGGHAEEGRGAAERELAVAGRDRLDRVQKRHPLRRSASVTVAVPVSWFPRLVRVALRSVSSPVSTSPAVASSVPTSPAWLSRLPRLPGVER